MSRDILIKNITIIENFNKWLMEKSIYGDYDYYDKDDDPENEELTDRIERILRHMESTLNFYKKSGYNMKDKTAFVQWLK